jgi:hypothetical protein
LRWSRLDELELTFGHIDKRLDKVTGRLGLQAGCQRVGRLAEQELGGGVHGVSEEQILQVHGRAIAGHRIDQMFDMCLKHVEIGNLCPGEIGADHAARPLPGRAVTGKDAMAKDGQENLESSLAEGIVLELGGQDGLDDFGFDGGDD